MDIAGNHFFLSLRHSTELPQRHGDCCHGRNSHVQKRHSTAHLRTDTHRVVGGTLRTRRVGDSRAAAILVESDRQGETFLFSARIDKHFLEIKQHT